MTIVLLASVCLFALVVAGRPLPSDSYAPTTPTLRNTLQSALQIHSGKDDLKSDQVVRFRPPSPKQQIEYISGLDVQDISAVASFEMTPGYNTPLGDTAGRQDALEVNGNINDFTNDPAASGRVVDKQQEALADHPIAPLAVLAFSCVAAFFALALVLLTLYVIRVLRSQMFASKSAWDLLPHFSRRLRSSIPQENTNITAKLCGGPLLLLTEIGQQHLPDGEEGSIEKHDMRMEDKPDAESDMESVLDDADGLYQDALDMTPLPFTHELPLEDYNSRFDDPPLPTLGSHPLDPPTGDRITPMTRELCSTPVSRPAWSVRAMDSPALGLTTRQGAGLDSTPLPLIHPRRRAYRSAVPEFDVALAMQLRPVLGIGADSAWMVRFLMAMFGWFAVALTGNAC